MTTKVRTKVKAKAKSVFIRVDDSTYKLLEQQATEQHRSLSGHCAFLLKEYAAEKQEG